MVVLGGGGLFLMSKVPLSTLNRLMVLLGPLANTCMRMPRKWERRVNLVSRNAFPHRLVSKM
jgi:hypothetical protein